jgi:hypothetical protein
LNSFFENFVPERADIEVSATLTERPAGKGSFVLDGSSPDC